MANIPGIKLGSMITPNGDDLNTFPTHEDIYGKGGLMAVSNLDEIKDKRKKPNMVASTNNGLFKYTGSAWVGMKTLSGTIGTSSTPVYINDGVPTQMALLPVSEYPTSDTPILVSYGGIKENREVTISPDNEITAAGFNVDGSCTILYDSTNKCLKFVF